MIRRTQLGLWLLVDGKEHYLPFDEFPWFRNASVRELTNVERPTDEHLRWPELDVDLRWTRSSTPKRTHA